MTPEQCRMARAALGWGVRELAKRAGISFTTISRFENGAGTQSSTLAKIQVAFETAGVTFIADDGGGLGVIVKSRNGAEHG